MAWLWALNLAGWPLVHVAVSLWATRRPPESFDPAGWLYRPRAWERGGRSYDRIFGVRRWKARLPDGAAWFRGGFAKGRLASSDPAYLRRFALETCRGEWAHWVTLAALPIFLWPNPPWACAVMTVYAVLANLPCIVVQRYNRAVLGRMIARRSSPEQL